MFESCSEKKGDLTLYHTILPFNDLEKEAFSKHCGKRRKSLYPAFSPFPTMFPTLPPPKNFNFSFSFTLLSANAFNLEQPKNMSFVKELTLYRTTKI